MIPVSYTVRDRGPTPRGLRKAHNAASKSAWFETGRHYHAEMTDRRFTQRHATQAHYAPRKANYQFRKFKEKGHTRPIEYSGTARRKVKEASITSTSKGAKVRYPGARVFNFKHPNSQVNMVDEFTRVLPAEADQLAAFYDRHLDDRYNDFNATNG